MSWRGKIAVFLVICAPAYGSAFESAIQAEIARLDLSHSVYALSPLGLKPGAEKSYPPRIEDVLQVFSEQLSANGIHLAHWWQEIVQQTYDPRNQEPWAQTYRSMGVIRQWLGRQTVPEPIRESGGRIYSTLLKIAVDQALGYVSVSSTGQKQLEVLLLDAAMHYFIASGVPFVLVDQEQEKNGRHGLGPGDLRIDLLHPLTQQKVSSYPIIEVIGRLRAIEARRLQDLEIEALLEKSRIVEAAAWKGSNDRIRAQITMALERGRWPLIKRRDELLRSLNHARKNDTLTDVPLMLDQLREIDRKLAIEVSLAVPVSTQSVRHQGIDVPPGHIALRFFDRDREKEVIRVVPCDRLLAKKAARDASR